MEGIIGYACQNEEEIKPFTRQVIIIYKNAIKEIRKREIGKKLEPDQIHLGEIRGRPSDDHSALGV